MTNFIPYADTNRIRIIGCYTNGIHKTPTP